LLAEAGPLVLGQDGVEEVVVEVGAVLVGGAVGDLGLGVDDARASSAWASR